MRVIKNNICSHSEVQSLRKSLSFHFYRTHVNMHNRRADRISWNYSNPAWGKQRECREMQYDCILTVTCVHVLLMNRIFFCLHIVDTFASNLIEISDMFSINHHAEANTINIRIYLQIILSVLYFYTVLVRIKNTQVVNY